MHGAPAVPRIIRSQRLQVKARVATRRVALNWSRGRVRLAVPRAHLTNGYLLKLNVDRCQIDMYNNLRGCKI